MVKDEDKPVTLAQCEQKHRSTWKILGFLVLLLTVLLAVGAGSGYSGYRAQQRLDVHEARQEECIKHINQTLERIEGLLRNKGD